MPQAGIVLMFGQPRQRTGHWINKLAVLDAPPAPAIVAVVAYYDARADEALLDVQYDARQFDAAARQYVANVARHADVAIFHPDRSVDDAGRPFVRARLARCAVRIEAQPTLVRAVMRLLQEIKIRRAAPAPTPPPLPPLSQSDRHKTNELQRRAPTPTPRRGRELEDHITSPLDLAAFQAMAGGRHPDRVLVRYLRGGRWIPARIGALGLKGASLLTGALPRPYDHVDVALSFGDRRAIVRGIVAKVSTRREATAMGAGVFTLRFMLDEHARPQLTALLVAARDAKVTIRPPPPRASRRFPVEWLVALGTAKGMVQATAIDVSVGGMFLCPDAPLLLDTTPTFSMALDDGDVPITGRAKVVRRISEAEAKTCGLVAGFGLAIAELTEAHRMRWLGFVARIERRAEKRVLIGAQPARLAELQSALANLGYAVVGGTDPGTLVELANGARAADAVLIDASWSKYESSTALVEEMLASRKVPCMRTEGEGVRVRQAIDRLLDVA